jgi:hypothetical protein
MHDSVCDILRGVQLKFVTLLQDKIQQLVVRSVSLETGRPVDRNLKLVARSVRLETGRPVRQPVRNFMLYIGRLSMATFQTVTESTSSSLVQPDRRSVGIVGYLSGRRSGHWCLGQLIVVVVGDCSWSPGPSASPTLQPTAGDCNMDGWNLHRVKCSN